MGYIYGIYIYIYSPCIQIQFSKRYIGKTDFKSIFLRVEQWLQDLINFFRLLFYLFLPSLLFLVGLQWRSSCRFTQFQIQDQQKKHTPSLSSCWTKRLSTCSDWPSWLGWRKLVALLGVPPRPCEPWMLEAWTSRWIHSFMNECSPRCTSA